MRFCSECGSAHLAFHIPDGDHRPRHQCWDCGHIFYKNPLIVVGCLPVYEEKLLLCRRGIQPQKGLWNVPGGFMENNESLEEGAAREVWEESHVRVHRLQPLSQFSWRTFNQVHIFFLAEMVTPEFQLTPESEEIRFFAPDEIPWSELAFPTNHFTLKAYLENLRTGQMRLHVGELG
jgi:ADP-ribose pyrophosphatase YjhB (NUDIX family)